MDISSPENMKYAAGEMFKTLAGGYSPPPVYGGNYQFLPGVPPFTIYAVDAMLHDYQVKLALQMLYVPVMKPQFALVGDPEICQFVEETMRKIWTGHIIDISQAMPYTRFGAETIYKKDPKDNRAKFHKMMPFHPRDFRIITRDREIAGLKIVNTWNDFTQNAESGPKNGMTDAAGFYIMAPKSFVYVHERRHGSFQGRSVLEGSYEPWLEKSQEGGAISSRSMWFYRSAFDGGVLWYPPGESIDEFGNKIPNADVAMKILESVRNGNAIAMENVTDDKGNPSWRYEKAQVTQGGDVILKYIDHLDHKIILGAGLPDDVISQNSGTGSYAGRTIPFIAFLESGTPTVRAITNCIKDQLIQPLIVWNFGHERGNDWDITEAKVNVDQFLGGQGADAGKGVAGDGDGDGVPNEAGMPGGGNGLPKNGPKQMSIAQVEELLERNYVETTGTNRKIFKNLGRLMGQSPEVSFVYEGRNRTSKIIGLPIQMSHDVSDEKRASDGKWTKDGSSAEKTVNEMVKPHVTETPAFQQWFGDSKVVDDDGKPLVVYHGTGEVFDSFNTEHGKDLGGFGGAGVFFSNSPSVASGYSTHQSLKTKNEMRKIETARSQLEEMQQAIAEKTNTRVPSERHVSRWMNDLLDQNEITQKAYDDHSELEDLLYDLENDANDGEDDTSPNVIPAYLSLKNPKVIDANGLNWELVVPSAVANVDRSKHDGIIFKNIKDSGDSSDEVATNYFVFNPNQIKSATGNKGSFDPNDPRISMSQSDSESSGHWITIGGHSEGKESHGGAKVFIGRNGKILKGPAALKGENVGHIGKQKPLSEKEQQQIDHEKRLQSAGRLGKYTLHSSHDKELAKLKNDRQERVLTEAEKDRLIALDVSRHHDPHEVKQQGFRPEIVKHAAEIHKKARKTGELASKPIDHASTREGIDARRAHAKAAGKTGHHYTESEARKLGSKEHIEAHGHAKQIAKELGISTHDVLQNMESAHKYLQGEHGERESAKARARELTGLNASNLAKIENAGGRDYSSVPGFDTASRTVAIEYPGLGLDPDDTDTPAAVWDLIREGKMNAPKLHDRQTAHQAGQWISSAKKQKVAKSDHNPDEDTSFNFGFGKSDSNDDWGGDSGFDPMDFGLGILDE